MSALKKLYEARNKIKLTNLKKAGYNTHSNYAYFTPEQVVELTSEPEFKLFNKFDLLRTELGLTARLTIIDMEEEKDTIIFEIATDIPVITATNIAQQLGGCVTYSERYLLQIAYDIKDNTLDFDAQAQKNKTESEKPENNLPWLNPSDTEKWNKAVEYAADNNINDILKKYKISKVNQEKLKTEALNYVKQ